uniref:Protein quiver n=1 Tax=Anopheles coluzzii TaxID=1518534 RepID=A0A6E8VVV8_ANOCL
MSKFYSIFMQMCVIAASMQTGLCIKCYNCDSTSNEECMDLKRNSAIVAETCTPSKMAATTGNWLADLTRIEYFGGTEITVPMVCQKIVASNENGDTMTYRGCQLDGGKTDPCQIAYGKAKLQRGVKIESCSICKDDACNGATRLALGPTVWLLIGGSSLLALIGFTSRRQFL